MFYVALYSVVKSCKSTKMKKTLSTLLLSSFISLSCFSQCSSVSISTPNSCPGLSDTVLIPATLFADSLNISQTEVDVSYSHSLQINAGSYQWFDQQRNTTFTSAILIPDAILGCNDTAVITVNKTRSFSNIPNGENFPVTLCSASFDLASGRNRVIWDKGDDSLFNIAFYTIYRSGLGGNISKVVSAQAYSQYIDSTSQPNNSAYSYWMTATDVCGNTSSVSNTHQTIWLESNLGTLNWTPFVGTDLSVGGVKDSGGAVIGNYLIYKKSLIDSLGNYGPYTYVNTTTNTTFSDNTYSPGDDYYVSVSIIPCDSSQSISAVLSNTLTIWPTGIDDVNQSATMIYPNPSNGSFIIKGVFGKYFITDISGRVMYNGALKSSTEINTNLTSGIYLITFRNTGETKKLVIK